MTFKYVTRFQVSGVGEFPIDMLRYDRCSPRDEADSHAITATFHHERESRGPIELVCYHERLVPHITPGRWESFLWKVNYQSVNTEKLP